MIIDRIDNWAAYGTSDLWLFAFDYLRSLSPESDLTEMRPLLGEDVMARVMSYTTCSEEEGVLEAHDSFVDIQMSLVGEERIDWFPRSMLSVKTPYDAASDVVFFERPAVAPVRIINQPGLFSVFFPGDAHAPQLMTGTSPTLVKKVVVKLRAAILVR